jgi:tape measure domain-containing protein
MNLARDEVAKVSQILRDTIPAHIKMRRELDLLEKAFSKSGQQTKTYAAAVQTVIDKYTPLTAKAKAAAAAQKEQERAQAALNAEMAKASAAATAVIRAGESTREKLIRQTNELKASYQKGLITNQQYRQSLAAIDTQMKATSTSSGGLLLYAKQIAAAYIGFQTIKGIATIAADVETASVQFKVLTGSVEEANVMMADMREFAAASPLSLSGVQKAARTLMSFGTETESVMPKVRLLGDITGGNQQRFEMLSLAYAQASAAGRLMGQDLLQMVNAGFNPLLEISDATGRSMLDLKKDMENGLISIAMVDEAMQRATGAGGRFSGMTAEMAKTFDGAYQQMVSAAQELAGTIGESVLPVVASMFRQIEKMTRGIMQIYNSMGQTSKSLLAGAAAFVAVVPIASKLIGIFVSISTALKGVAIAQAIVIAMGGPKGWAILAAGAVAAGVAIYGINRAMDQTAVAAAPAAEGAKKAASAMSSLGVAADDTAMKVKTGAEVYAEYMAKVQAGNDAFEQEITPLIEKRNELMFGVEAVAMQRMQAAGMTDAQIREIGYLKEQVALLDQKAKKEAKFAAAQESATQAALAYFEAQKKADQDRRDQITKGPQAADVGSAEAARIIAEQRNAQLANRVVPQRETTQEELIAKTKELLIAQAAEAKRQAELLIAVKAATAAMLDTRPKLFRG